MEAPSRSTKRAASTYAAEQAGMERFLRWRRHLDEAAWAHVQDMLDLLEMTLYSASSPCASGTHVE